MIAGELSSSPTLSDPPRPSGHRDGSACPLNQDGARTYGAWQGIPLREMPLDEYCHEKLQSQGEWGIIPHRLSLSGARKALQPTMADRATTLIDWLLAGKRGLPGTIELELRERSAAALEEQRFREMLAVRLSILVDAEECQRKGAVERSCAAGVSDAGPLELSYKVTKRGVVVAQGKAKRAARKVLRRKTHVGALLDAERDMGAPVDRSVQSDWMPMGVRIPRLSPRDCAEAWSEHDAKIARRSGK